MIRKLALSISIVIIVATCVFGLKISPYVTGYDAYAHYMPPGYGQKSFFCKVTVWGRTQAYYQVRDEFLRCTLIAAAQQDADPRPYQWRKEHVRLLAESPKR